MLNDIKILMGYSVKPAPQPIKTPKKIIVVENDKSLADSLINKLTTNGFTVSAADNGEEGLALITNQKPDALILNLTITLTNGKSLLKQIRETAEFKALTIMLITNTGDIDTMREATLYYNVDEFIIKSNLNLDEVVIKLNHYVNHA